MIEGAGRKMLEKIKISDTIIAPKVIRRSTLNDEMSLSAIFSNTNPSIIVTIDNTTYSKGLKILYFTKPLMYRYFVQKNFILVYTGRR